MYRDGLNFIIEGLFKNKWVFIIVRIFTDYAYDIITDRY